MTLLLLALLVLIIWLGLWLSHAGFWRVDRAQEEPAPALWPAILVIIPARNEEEGIAPTLHSLWAQNYPGSLRIVVVDDGSEDRTAECAWQASKESGQEAALTILPAEPLPPGWTGKVWAMQQGLQHGLLSEDAVRYVLFSDADITHGAGAIQELVCRAEAHSLDLVSFMVRLHCQTTAEKLMIPAFVFFFKMLYPFGRVNAPNHPLAGAAGGTMLIRREALERIGGLECIRQEIIDDCALARAIKRGGHPIWLGLSETSHSTRRYDRLSEILDMVARTAYAQLGYSPLSLLGCIAGLILVYLLPVILLFAGGWTDIIAGITWLLMSLLYLPMVRFYRQSPLWAFLLPLTALLYLSATLLSALRHHQGRGGQWKGRSQSPTV